MLLTIVLIVLKWVELITHCSLSLKLCLFLEKTVHISRIFLKCITKKFTTLTWKYVVKQLITNIYFGTIEFKSSQEWNLHQKMLQIIQLYCRNLCLNESFTNSEGVFLRFPFTNSTLEIFQWAWKINFWRKKISDDWSKISD